MKEIKFQEGDIVEAFGVRGKVTKIYPQSVFKVEVTYDDINRLDYFSPDGRLDEWHKTPALKLIERAKERICVEMYSPIFRSTYGTWVDSILLKTMDEALQQTYTTAKPVGVAKVQVYIEREYT